MARFKYLHPFFQHVLIGILFILTGTYIMEVFNKHAIGILGMLATGWGAFQLLIGTAIYGITLYSKFFNPKAFTKTAYEFSVKKASDQIKKDLTNKEAKKAIDRVHGILAAYPDKLELRYWLGKLYWQAGNDIQAGRYFYFKPDPTKEERDLVHLFEKSVGNNSFQILRHVIIPTKLNESLTKSVKTKLTHLVSQIDNDVERDAWQTRQVNYFLKQVNVPLYTRVWSEYKSTILQVIALCALWLLVWVI